MNFRLSLRFLLRERRAGELRLLVLALVIAVASLSSVGFLSDRVKVALERESHQMLGADLLLTADRPWTKGDISPFAGPVEQTVIDRARAETLVFRLAREERDAWVTWPARVARDTPPPGMRTEATQARTSSGGCAIGAKGRKTRRDSHSTWATASISLSEPKARTPWISSGNTTSSSGICGITKECS